MCHVLYVDGKNYFNDDSFQEMINHLNNGSTIQVGISCIGHTRNNIEQEKYKEHLTDYFGNELEVKLRKGLTTYNYIYKLKKI